MHSYVKNAVYEVARDLSRYNRQVVNMEPVIAQYLKPEVANNKNEKTIDGLKQRRGDISLESVSVLSHLKRKTDIIDVRHCSMQRPKSAADVGTTVLKGETEKHEFYDKHFAFPPGYQMIPFVIDTYGRWGNKAKEWLEKECRHVAGTDDGFYNSLISRYRETISLAHARGIGRTLERCIQNCIHPDDYPKTCSRGEGAIPA